MSQAQEIICLSKQQIKTTMENWFKILNITKHSIISSGKPVFSKENEAKWNLQHISKFADNYTLYKCEGNEIGNMYFIVLEATKFDKLNVSACSWYYHLFENDLKTTNIKPQVYICPAYVITDSMLTHIPNDILPCLYRFVSLCEIYPMIGSSEQLFGLTFDYKVIPNHKVFNGRKYSIIYDSDPIVKILNALPGEIIEYKRIIFEGSPYSEYYRREIVSVTSDITSILPSGLCYMGKTEE